MRVLAAVAVAISLAPGASRLFAQGQSGIHIPYSSIEKPGEAGQEKAHTNHVIALRRDGAANGLGPGGWNIAGAGSFRLRCAGCGWNWDHCDR